MKIVNIEGFPSHLYKEGSGYLTTFKRKSSYFNKSPHYIKKKVDKIFIKQRFDFFEVDSLTVLDQKYDQHYREKEDYKITPFVEKKESYKKTKKNSTTFKQTLGFLDGNELFLELDEKGFQDKENLNLKEFVMLSESDINNYLYPIQFNSTSFHRRGGKIDLFNLINKITMSSFGVDNLKGFKGFAFNNSQNSLDENIKIKSTRKTNDISQVHFEDGVLQDVLYNKNATKKIDKIDVLYNPITKEYTNFFHFKDTVKISNEPRYTKNIEKLYRPFKDYDNNKNNPYLKNNENFYYNKLRDVDLNDKLINNSTYINKINEEILYTCAGKSIDYSISPGKESLIYYESLD